MNKYYILYNHGDRSRVYDEIVRNAKLLSADGENANMTLIAMGDEAIINAVNKEKQYLKEKLAIPQILFVYLMLFMPLHDIYIGYLINNLIQLVYR